MQRIVDHAYRSWDRRGLRQAVRSVLLDQTGIIDELQRIAAPALAVSGGMDTILPAEIVRRIAASLPNARLAEVSDAAHLIRSSVRSRRTG